MNLSLEDEEEECPELIPPPADNRKHSFVSWLSLLKAVLRNPEGFIPDPATSVPDPTKIVPDLTKIILNMLGRRINQLVSLIREQSIEITAKNKQNFDYLSVFSFIFCRVRNRNNSGSRKSSGSNLIRIQNTG